MIFFDNVKSLVKQRNQTLRSFIESLGINYDSYNTCKKCSNLPRADEAVKIAKSLGVSVEYLVTGEESNQYKVQLDQLKETLRQLANS
jgi:transcriptional regulator with XRE-family HTH domain